VEPGAGRVPELTGRSLMIKTAALPSEICDELAAVTRPWSRNALRTAASVSTVDSGRMPSSRANGAASPAPGTATTSRSKRPSSTARCARRCDSTLYASRSVRVRFQRSQSISAPIPWETRPPAGA
jgi:hypothetical protein